MHNKQIHSDAKKRRSFLNMHFVAGDLRRLGAALDDPAKIQALLFDEMRGIREEIARQIETGLTDPASS